MTTTPATLETLQTQNRELRLELTRAQTEIHYLHNDRGSLYHRGPFANCPSPDCVRVRVLLGREENGNG